MAPNTHKTKLRTPCSINHEKQVRSLCGCVQQISLMTHYVTCCLQLCCVVVATKLPSVSLPLTWQVSSVTLRLLRHACTCTHWLVGVLSCLPLTDMTEKAEKASDGTELSSQWLHTLLTVSSVHAGCVLDYVYQNTYYDEGLRTVHSVYSAQIINCSTVVSIVSSVMKIMHCVLNQPTVSSYCLFQFHNTCTLKCNLQCN